MTTATPNEHSTAMHATEPLLFLAFALREKTWKLGCTTGHGQQPRERSIPARHQERLLHEVAQATRRFGLPETGPWCVAMKRAVKASGCIAFCRRTGSPTRWWIVRDHRGTIHVTCQ
jgi:hypothetical protein